MNWQHLIYFHKIVEAGSFSAASKQLYITSSALSKAIQNLESELEFPLFEKQGRKATLTEYGREFDCSVKKAIDIMEGQIQSIHERTGIVSGKLRVSGVWTMVGGYLPEKIRAFHVARAFRELILRDIAAEGTALEK